MKNALLIIIATLFLTKPILPLLDYMVNYDYITKVLCENKTKPELKCNGKCHLAKELAKASEEEKPISQNKKHQTSEIEILFYNQITEFNFNCFCFTQNKINAIYKNLYKSDSTNSTFHPPILFV